VSHFDQYPLVGCEWSACIACAVGESTQVESLLWDRDDPFGAAEALLLAGSRAAVDCMSPVPEVLAAILIEEAAFRIAHGEESECAFADTLKAHRNIWKTLVDSLAVHLRDNGIPDTDELSSWLLSKLDRIRRERLGIEVLPLPPFSIFHALGDLSPARAGDTAQATGRDLWARKSAAQMLESFTTGEVWGAFRWMGRK
jgi:hypothetical protein